MRYVSLLMAVGPLLSAQAAASGTAPRLPAFFIEEAPSHYLVEASGMRARFSREGVTYQTAGGFVQARFVGGRQDSGIAGSEAGGQANFLIGQDPGAWRTGLPVYGEIRYRGLYSGIDLAYRGAEGRLKSEYLVAPGADPRQIRVAYSEDLSIDDDGGLRAGDLQEKAPEIYQDTPAGRVTVEGHYRLLDARTVGFEIADYDSGYPLVIDPVISYATYLGGTGLGAVTALAVDSGGNLYATGWTEALNFPISHAVQAANLGGVDAFVVKLNSTGSALVYATYIGGRGEDKGTGIAVDSSGQAHVVGSTASTNFPLAAAMQTALGGSKTAFALKLNAAGSALVFSTYLGGTNYDVATAVAVDAAGNTYVAGDTQSINFPLIGAPQVALGGGTDVFVSALTSAGVLTYSTYLGGSSDDHAGGIAVDSTGNMYVAGGTYSANFPIVAGAVQGVMGGSQDAFVTKLAAAGFSLVYSTYLGGSGSPTPEEANAIAVDNAGNAYVAGVTNSANFPVTAGAYQTVFAGVSDAFVAKLNSSGKALVYSTYLGSSSFDWANGIAIDAGGNAYVAGYTASSDFPVLSGTQIGFGGLYDAFVSKIGASGNVLGFSTFFGGSGSDTANAIAVDSSGNMFAGGETSSRNLPLAGPIQSANNGGSVGWVARLGVTAPPPPGPAVVSVTPSTGNGNAPVFTATYSDASGAAALSLVSLLVSASGETTFSCYVTFNPAANLFTLGNDDPSTGGQTVVPGGSTAQNDQCMLVGTASSATLAGTTLTLNISLSFLPGFAGVKTVYLYAADAASNTGSVAKSTWTVSTPPSQPSADSVSPNASSGGRQTFTFVFSDSQNAANLLGMGMLFSSSNSTFSNACYLVVDRTAGTISLSWDSALGADVRLLGSSTNLQNSQCGVGAATLTVSGLSQILSFTITFTGAFGGPHNIYMYGGSGPANTGWVQRGTFLVTAGGVPIVNSVVPATGTGTGQRFSFTISDGGGYTFLTGMEVLISPTLSNLNACYLAYDRNANTVAVGYENPANGSTPLVPGSNTIASNNQCSLKGLNTTVAFGTIAIVVTLDLTFNASWTGAKNIYVRASESTLLNSGWVQVGTWNVTGGSPTADSVSPASGSGNSPNFTFTVSDSALQSNISGMTMLITTGAPTNLTNACYLVYDRTTSTIGLYNDTATTLSTKGIGYSTNLQNSHCAVGYTVMFNSGTSVMFTINTVFTNFSGTKTVYLQANEPGANSGFVQRGTWTVP